MTKKRVLILCTGNCCRSQMAEGWWRHLGGDAWDVFSAGSHPVGYVHPMAIEVMRDAGVDISSQMSKHVDEFVHQPLDLVITVCDHARDACPTLPGAKHNEHWPFGDPIKAVGTHVDALAEFRRVSRQIREAVATFLE